MARRFCGFLLLLSGGGGYDEGAGLYGRCWFFVQMSSFSLQTTTEETLNTSSVGGFHSMIFVIWIAKNSGFFMKDDKS